MTLLTSDGRMFVFAVFAADGCECVDLLSLHDEEEAATEAAAQANADPDLFGPSGRYGEFGRSHGGAYVESVEVKTTQVVAPMDTPEPRP